MAKAAELKGEQRQVVAVIGDGSMTGGLAVGGPVGARLWSRPSPRPRRDEKRVPFSALHPPAQTRGCAPVLRRKTAERGSFSYIWTYMG